MTEPTTDDIVQLLAKFAQNRQSREYMTDELKEGLHQLVDIAFSQTFPDPLDERHYTERAAAGFALGFACGRDWEAGQHFTEQFGDRS